MDDSLLIQAGNYLLTAASFTLQCKQESKMINDACFQALVWLFSAAFSLFWGLFSAAGAADALVISGVQPAVILSLSVSAQQDAARCCAQVVGSDAAAAAGAAAVTRESDTDQTLIALFHNQYVSGERF